MGSRGIGNAEVDGIHRAVGSLDSRLLQNYSFPGFLAETDAILALLAMSLYHFIPYISLKGFIHSARPEYICRK